MLVGVGDADGRKSRAGEAGEALDAENAADGDGHEDREGEVEAGVEPVHVRLPVRVVGVGHLERVGGWERQESGQNEEQKRTDAKRAWKEGWDSGGTGSGREGEREQRERERERNSGGTK